jgi:hypothetical protein
MFRRRLSLIFILSENLVEADKSLDEQPDAG